MFLLYTQSTHIPFNVLFFQVRITNFVYKLLSSEGMIGIITLINDLDKKKPLMLQINVPVFLCPFVSDLARFSDRLRDLLNSFGYPFLFGVHLGEFGFIPLK